MEEIKKQIKQLKNTIRYTENKATKELLKEQLRALESQI
jgi:peptidoglycan hydrolase CwlO-like protein